MPKRVIVDGVGGIALTLLGVAWLVFSAYWIPHWWDWKAEQKAERARETATAQTVQGIVASSKLKKYCPSWLQPG